MRKLPRANVTISHQLEAPRRRHNRVQRFSCLRKIFYRHKYCEWRSQFFCFRAETSEPVCEPKNMLSSDKFVCHRIARVQENNVQSQKPT